MATETQLHAASPVRGGTAALQPGVCPPCGVRDGQTLVTPAELAALARFHRQFQLRCARRSRPAWKERVGFVHAYEAGVVRCRRCGVLYRDPCLTPQSSRERYQEDAYDRRTLECLWDAYLPQYRRRVRRLRRRLPPGSRVLEVGSYVGAFLAAGREAGWITEGVDVGAAATAFAQGRGLAVRLGDVRELSLPVGAYDGVFIWNCFEQVPDVYGLVRRARDLLPPGGVLALRTPNAACYTAAVAGMRRDPAGVTGPAAEWLSWSGLLPFPFAAAYPPEALRRLLVAGGFVDVEVRGTRPAVLGDPIYRWGARLRALALSLGRGAQWEPWLEATAERPDR